MLNDMKDEDKWIDCKKHFVKKVNDKYGERKLDILLFGDCIRIEIVSSNPYITSILLSNKEIKRIFGG